MDFPMMTSPVMPCSVAVFTIGLLLAFSQRVNLFLILFLCHWALIGFTKTYFFQIPEDFLRGDGLCLRVAQKFWQHRVCADRNFAYSRFWKSSLMPQIVGGAHG
jgi:hypothetical protein